MSGATVLMFDRRRAGSVSEAAKLARCARESQPAKAEERTGGDRAGRGRSGAVRRPACSGSLRLVRARASAPPVAKTFAPEVYREHTEGLLRRYVKMSLEVGRTPSFLGRELFRTGVTSHNSVYSFEDVVIFVCDVESCVAMLPETGRRLVTRIGMQEYTTAEVARVMGASERSIARWYFEALDALTTILIQRGVMQPFVCG